jgi:rhamnosyltransferase
LVAALAPQVFAVVVVDNGSEPTTVEHLAAAVSSIGGSLLRLPQNLGIAAAQNLGIARARELGAAFVLLSDQDSEPGDTMVQRLVSGYALACAGDRRVGAVGPLIVDERMPGAALLFAPRRWGPRRATIPPDRSALIPVTFLLASGCLVPVDVLDRVGEMNAPWFIDHIDLEWGLRARRAGYELFGVPDAVLHHHLGDRLVSIPGRKRDVHVHSPVRNYYMARNTVLLIRSGLLPVTWRWGYAAWITKYAVFYVVTMRPRTRRARAIFHGVRDGLRGRTGPAAT